MTLWTVATFSGNCMLRLTQENATGWTWKDALIDHLTIIGNLTLEAQEFIISLEDDDCPENHIAAAANGLHYQIRKY